MIEIKNVTFHYSGLDQAGLCDFNLSVTDGECILLCGASGCGKTTVTRLINGLIPHFFKGELTGDVYVNGLDIVHAEIMLPAYAPPEFADRSILWNSVEQIEKARDSQLAREIEAALPRELSGEQQLALVRAYVKDNFVDKGMCADFAIHDKGTGNPHVHIMLTLRPLKENGQWGAKCRKAYDLDENGQRIPDGKGGWKNHREDCSVNICTTRKMP